MNPDGIQQPLVPTEPPAPQVPEVPPIISATSTTPVAPIETNDFVPENPKKSSPLSIIAIILAVVALLAVVAYVFGAKYFAPQLTLTPTPVAVVTPSSTPDESANWITYNKSFFSVKAPPQLRYEERFSNENLLALDQWFPTSEAPEWSVAASFGYLYSIGIIKCATNEECYNNFDTGVKAAAAAGSKTIVTNITSNILGRTITGFRLVDLPSDKSKQANVDLLYPISHDGKYFQIDFSILADSVEKADQLISDTNIDGILSTFRFIEATPSSSPTATP